MGFRFKNIMPTLCPAVLRSGHCVGSNIYFAVLPQLHCLVFNTHTLALSATGPFEAKYTSGQCT